VRILLLFCSILLSAAPAGAQKEPVFDEDGLYAVMVTDLGVMGFRLEAERAPLTVANFVGLAEGTREFLDPRTGEPARRPFYDGNTFHRVVPGLLIQAGDPTGLGHGGPGYRFRDELDTGLRHDRPGTLSMANAGPGTNGSQFFITVKPTPWLDGMQSVFGYIVEGLDVAEAIASVPVQSERPTEPVHLREVRIVRVGEAAADFDAEAVFADLVDLTAAEWTALKARRFEEKTEELLADAQAGPHGTRWVRQSDGSGDPPAPEQVVLIQYDCYRPDGVLVESTRRRERPVRLVAGEPLPGLDWLEILLEMRPGERRWVEVPPREVFGGRGLPAAVPPDTGLLVDLELVGTAGAPTP
jgi:peptidyl-prolyl cis-trans isomerase A (cyclophilin A)